MCTCYHPMKDVQILSNQSLIFYCFAKKIYFALFLHKTLQIALFGTNMYNCSAMSGAIAQSSPLILQSCCAFKYQNTKKKCKIQNTKCKIQNTKNKIQNTKFKIQNTKYRNNSTPLHKSDNLQDLQIRQYRMEQS